MSYILGSGRVSACDQDDRWPDHTAKDCWFYRGITLPAALHFILLLKRTNIGDQTVMSLAKLTNRLTYFNY